MSTMPAEPPPLTACVQGIGLVGPGLADWESSARVLAGEETYTPQPTVVPAPAGLPAAERRRTGATVKLALSAAQQAVAAAGIDPVGLSAVFSSSGGDGLICHEICETLASADRQVSPTRFHNSVHNAAAGYWSLATGATAGSTALCAYDGSFSAGLVEALALVSVDRVPVLLCAYETTYPEPLRSKRPLPEPFAMALVLTPAPAPGATATTAAGTVTTHPRLTARLGSTAATADRVPDPRLEALRTAMPAARCLPLLRLLAHREPGEAVLEYVNGQSLVVQVGECR